MTEPVKRSYESAVREESARQTRRSVRDAAGRLFISNGYVATTVREIAEAAGVSVRTLFNAFPGGKAEMFDAALDTALGGDERRIMLRDRALTTRPLVEEDPATLIGMIADGAVELYERAGDLIATYLASSGADAHMRQHAQIGAAEATKIMQRYARVLAKRQALRAGLTAHQAADVLLALCSPQVHHLLRHERSWSLEAYRQWLADELERALLASTATVPGTRSR